MSVVVFCKNIDLRALNSQEVAIKYEELTHAPLGYSAERAPLGGADSAPLSNSRTDGRRKRGKTANESSQQDES